MNQSLKQNPHIQLYGAVSNSNWYRWFRIIVFQFIATVLLIYGQMCSMYMTTPYPIPTNYQPVHNPGHSIFVSCALFLSLCFAGQLTGGHCNPAVTLTLLISKGNKITWIIALVYIISQYVGAIAGGFLSWQLIDNFYVPSPSSTTASGLIRSFVAEVFGTFLYTLFILIIVNDKTTFVRSNFWNYLLVPLMYYIARQLTGQIDGLNPAVVMGMFLTNGASSGNWQPFSTYWIFLIGPIGGAICSGLFFNKFYLPLFIRWKAKK